MDSLALSLTAKYFGVSAGRLLVGGIPIEVIAKKYGTPAFVYDRKVLDAKLDALGNALPSRFSIFYSVKANPNDRILRHFVARGCGLEIASGGEFKAALEAGCDPQRILFAGPGKTESELELVLSRGIGEIHLESLREAQRIGAISRRLRMRANVAIRVNPSGEVQGGAMRMGGRSAPFGVDEEILDEVLDAVLDNEALHLRGIHIFSGTQILDAAVLLSQYRHGLEIARRVSQRVGGPLHTVDFGGGLGIPYFAREQDLDLRDVQRGLSELFAEIEGDP